MRFVASLFVLFFVTSCNYFEKEKVYSEDLLKEELQTFNWNEVDTYPTFSTCDSLTRKEDSKRCFQNTLITKVNTYLNEQNLVVTNDVSDTIILQLTIDKSGNLSVESIAYKPETKMEIPEIDSLLINSLKTVPKIYPAIKRGQQVTTSFEFPVVVKIN
ncbi:hypothetical protein [Winogradskyella alexanderae]|uniref:TonB C-terminal domain-containing protein n=1 Tax=Winogradskyella alexanderae TaxID=2877123 RepID=A0ABS7XRB9_9FLAO|nr:hypothetical protein [Winogradskyella alexanderae]MCA0131586.1 hypothetical protein [Winogradskyella alexanderae]